MTNVQSWLTGDADRYDSLLGRMIREAATLEHFLEAIVKELCGSPYGALLVSGEPTSRILTVWRTLGDARDDIPAASKQEVKDLVPQIKEAFDRRNQYVHGAIAWEGEGVPGTMRGRRLKSAGQFEKLDIDDLADLANEFNRLSFAVSAWFRSATEQP